LPGPGGGDLFTLVENVTIKVGAPGENGAHPVIIDTERKIHGLGLTLRDLGGAQLNVISNLNNVELYWSQTREIARVGLMDIYGQGYIAPGIDTILSISGSFEIVSVEATEILADGTVDAMRPQLANARTATGSGGVLPVVSLDAVYPNPFNPKTNVLFTISADALVTIDIYNILGQRVRTLTDEVFGAGSHIVEWDGAGDTGNQLASGVYFIRFVSGSYSARKTLLILK